MELDSMLNRYYPNSEATLEKQELIFDVWQEDKNEDNIVG